MSAARNPTQRPSAVLPVRQGGAWVADAESCRAAMRAYPLGDSGQNNSMRRPAPTPSPTQQHHGAGAAVACHRPDPAYASGMSDDVPADLIAVLTRLRAADPSQWLDQVADAVVALGGPDAGDLLCTAADRAASGVPASETDEAGDADAALRALEADLTTPPLPHLDPVQTDLLAHLPPLDLPRQRTPRDMSN